MSDLAADVACCPGAPQGDVKPPTIDPAARLRGSQKGTLAAAQRRREDAEAAMLGDDAWSEIIIYRAEGKSLHGIADELNAEDYTAPRGGPWHAAQVQRVIRRVLSIIDDLIDDHAMVLGALRQLRTSSTQQPSVSKELE